MNDRIQTLKSFIAEDPTDPFNHYALAMELKNQNPQDGLKLLEHLTLQFPEYLPSYYQLAELLADLNQPDQAKALLHKGIDLALQQKNHKTLAELRQFLSNLENEY